MAKTSRTNEGTRLGGGPIRLTEEDVRYLEQKHEEDAARAEERKKRRAVRDKRPLVRPLDEQEPIPPWVNLSCQPKHLQKHLRERLREKE